MFSKLYIFVENTLTIRGTGQTHVSVTDGKVSYRLWSIGWFEKDNQEKANAAVIIVDSGKQIEPEYLYNDATTLHLESLQGSGKVVVSDPEGVTFVHKITTEMESPIEIKPGSAYAVFANGEEPLVLLDYCDPPYKPGMETPVERNSSTSDIKIPEEFWAKCDEVA